jgi:hypothetical protein
MIRAVSLLSLKTPGASLVAVQFTLDILRKEKEKNLSEATTKENLPTVVRMSICTR